MDKCYSCNEDEYYHTSIEDAVEDLWNGGQYEIGEVATIWEGDPDLKTASHFTPNMAEYLQERAYDELGEVTDSWEFSEKEDKSLQNAVNKAVDDWATANNMQPKFYSVENVREIQVRFTNEDGDFEVVPTATPNLKD